ncbi:MAG: prepilin-type N-terminal cleavage/methylation domain-containing protein [Candidatus Omnitrophota bacterium]
MKKAFTILEVLVVLSVIAILIAVAIPSIKGMRDEANVTKVKSELRTLQSAIESYAMHTSPRAYPPQSSHMIAASLVPALPQIIDATLYDPFGDTPSSEYTYALSNDGKSYAIYSLGPNKTSATQAPANNGDVVTGGDDVVATNGQAVSGGVEGADGNSCGAGQVLSSGTCGPGTITIVAATFGANCGGSSGNVTGIVAGLCNGQSSCNFSEGVPACSSGPFPDVTPGCYKDFSVSYTCSGSGSKSASAPARQCEGYPISLSCP